MAVGLFLTLLIVLQFVLMHSSFFSTAIESSGSQGTGRIVIQNRYETRTLSLAINELQRLTQRLRTRQSTSLPHKTPSLNVSARYVTLPHGPGLRC
jgi:hypothetical protein